MALRVSCQKGRARFSTTLSGKNRASRQLQACCEGRCHEVAGIDQRSVLQLLQASGRRCGSRSTRSGGTSTMTAARQSGRGPEKLFERALCERHVLESLTAGTLDIRAEICDFGNCQAMIYQVVADPPRSQGSMRKSA